tara:strand:- start:2953 stop:4458 length:1506 start_codon:yes stop_codon:yes gene_type:complete
LKLKPTPQQSQVVQFKGGFLIVKAGAGSGKTTTLKEFAKANPRARMLYLAFNKSIQEEASQTFPPNVVCRTTHSIAYRRVGIKLKHKLTQNMRISDVKSFLNTPNWTLVNDAIKAFNNFLTSADAKIAEKHAAFIDGDTSKHQRRRNEVVQCARKIWEAAIDPNHTFFCTHDVYLKLYCLSEPEMHNWFTYILLDEAQDTNPVTADFVMRQQCNQILVGDDHQQIYRWRGANNAMEEFRKRYNADVLYLTQSFRFGTSIANMANSILYFKSTVTGCDLFQIEGTKSIQDRWVSYKEMENTIHTVLHRTVAGTLETALAHKDKPIYWIGGLENYNVQELLDVYHFSIGVKDKIKRKKLLSEFHSYSMYEEAAEQAGDPEMKRICKLIKEYGGKLVNYIDKLRVNEAKNELDARIVIGTSHRSKGLEFDSVHIAEDFIDFFDESNEMTAAEIADELNLLYVAGTRAIKRLSANSLMYRIHDEVKEIKAKKHKTERKPVPVVED